MRKARLPDGAPRSCGVQSLDGYLLRLHLLTDGSDTDLGATALVEVESEATLYLGEVQGRQGSVLIVTVEHAISRASLSAIQDVWHCP